MSQTAYTTYQSIGFAGQLADNGDHEVLSYINAEASANMPFGIALKKGTGDQDAKLPAASADVTAAYSLIGVAVHTHQVDPGHVASSPVGAGAPPKYAVNVLTRGRILVQVEEAVTPTSPVFVRFAAGAGGTQLGAFRASADTATAVATPGTNLRYLTSAAAAGFAVLEVNLP